MKRRLTLALCAILAVIVILAAAGLAYAGPSAAPRLQGGAPAVVSYQGQVKVSGAPYSGTAYFKFAVVDAAASASYWSNDGTSTAGSQPTAAVPLAVSAGLFNVLLGDTSQSGMTQALGAPAFAEPDRFLRVWFSSDGSTFQLLSPDRRVAAVPYALQAQDAGTVDGQDASSFWNVAGNAGTSSGANYLGTTDAVSLTVGVSGTARVQIDTAGNVGIGTTTPAERLTVRGDALILGDDNPAARGFTSTNLAMPWSVYVSGRYAYVASLSNHRLAIFDVSDPDNIVARGYTSTNLDGPQSVYVSGRYAYVASQNNNRLAIFDVSDPDNIVAKGYNSANLDLPRSVYVSGRYAYVTSKRNERLAIFDVSDPDNIVARGYTSTNLNGAESVCVSGRYAYVTSVYNDRLVIFDVSDPDSIVARGYTSTNLDGPMSVYVSGRYAYVASLSNHRLAIFDVSDPDNIVARGYTSTNLDGGAYSVYVSGHYAYVTSVYNDRLAIFDVSDPDNIVARGYTSTNLDGAVSVYVSGRYAYVISFSNSRLAIFELNNLEAPTVDAGSIEAGNLDVTDNAIVGNNLHVQGGLNVGPGGALIGGNTAVQGDLRVTGPRVQFPTISGAPPAAADCDEASDAGQIVVRTDGATNLYVCTGTTGWVGK